MIQERIDYTYQTLLKKIIDNGYDLPPAERQEVGTRQINAFQIECDLRDGFPLLTTKELSFKNIVVELLWFLKGDTNIKYLVDNECNIWNKDAYKFYLKKFNKSVDGISYTLKAFVDIIKKRDQPTTEWFHEDTYKLGDLGPIYGQQWRKRTNIVFHQHLGVNEPVDQIANLIRDIKEVIAKGYNDRGLLVDAWNPGELKQMGLRPCHYGFQVILEPIRAGEQYELYKQLGKDYPKYFLNLTWNQRSTDTFLGLPYNTASYALLAHILGRITNTIPKSLTGNLACVHLYNNHLEQAEVQLQRLPKELPTLVLDETFDWNIAALNTNQIDLSKFINNLHYTDFRLINYEPHPPIKAEMNA